MSTTSAPGNAASTCLTAGSSLTCARRAWRRAACCWASVGSPGPLPTTTIQRRPVTRAAASLKRPTTSEGTPAAKGDRPVHWGDGFVDTQIYELGDVEPGNSIVGPAIVESVATTFAIPPGRGARLDRHQIFHLGSSEEG